PFPERGDVERHILGLGSSPIGPLEKSQTGSVRSDRASRSTSSFASPSHRPAYTPLPRTTPSYGSSVVTSSGGRTSVSTPAVVKCAPIALAISAVEPCFEAAVTRTFMEHLLGADLPVTVMTPRRCRRR